MDTQPGLTPLPAATPEATVAVELKTIPLINYALQQNDMPLVLGLRLTNQRPEALEEVTLAFSSEPDFARPHELRLARLEPGETHEVGLLDLPLSHDWLAGLTERLVGTLRLEVRAGAELLATVSQRLDLFAYDEWPGSRIFPEALAAFVTPNHPGIERLLAEATDWLGRWTGDHSLAGYQDGDPQRVMQLVAAIYLVLQQRGLRYINPPASFESMGQKIRTAERLLENRLGTCLDLAVLFASCLEQAGLHPLIIIIEGHAFAGWWLLPQTFADASTEDPLRLRKRLELDELVLLETTALTSPEPVPFERAVEEGRRHLKQLERFTCVVDIQRARMARIRPLPLRTERPAGAAATTAPTAPPPLPPPDRRPIDLPPLETAAPTPVTRLEVWKRKLLDLSLRNRLLNFRDTQRAMQVLCPDLPAIEDALSDGERFTVHPRPVEFDEGWRAGEIHRQRTGDDLALELLRGEFAAHRLRTPLPPGELDRRLVQIYREARTSLEENGANTVYLALGFLSWRETKSSPENRYAPILLVPLEIERRSLQEGFSLRRGDDEPVVNTTLLELLAKDHELRIPGLDPLPHDEHGVDVRAVMQRFRQAIRDIDGWEVIEAAFIGLFSFTKFLMWRDLEVRAEELQQNRVVRHLIRTPNEPFEETAWPDLERLDETHLPQATYCLLSADSSQLAAVYAAAAGRSFVLHGPPGTGKSQTITNLIAHALADGRTVLFVSEKAAALNVVHRRLVDCGLGPFCLELHSNKSHKIEVLRQFEEVLQFAAPRVPEEWAREAERLTALRRGLNHYVEALHRPRATGESLFAALTRLMELRGGPSPRIAWAAHGPWDAARLELLNATARELQETVQRQPHLADSPWQHVTTPTWSLAWREQVEEALGRLQLATAALAAAASELVALLQLPAGPWSMAGLGGLFDLSRAVLGAADLPPTLLDQDDWQLTAALLKQWITAGRHRDALRAALLARYRPEVLQLDAAVLQERLVETDQRWALVRNRGRKAVASELARCALDARALPDLVAELAALRDCQAAGLVVAAAEPMARVLLGSAWADGEADWDQVEAWWRWLDTFVEVLGRVVGGGEPQQAVQRQVASLRAARPELWQASGAVSQACGSYQQAARAFNPARQELEKSLGVAARAVWGGETDPDLLGRVAQRVEAWQAGLGELREWCHWCATRQTALALGLEPLVTAIELGELAPAEVVQACGRSFTQWFVQSTIDAEPSLSSFRRRDFEARLEEFREVDQRFTALTRSVIQARLAGRVPRPGQRTSENSEMGILLRQIKRQRGHLSIRSLFAQIPTLVPRLKPCLLMSPLSVAQYLDPAAPKFDLVVFDEASQIPVWDAIGAMARGREVIVVGDPKQLPPTSFFNRGDDDDALDDGTVEDMESILDDCLAARLPECHLKWHYRSRHESLIAFSNHRYYDSRLLTFPSPHAEPAVTLRAVPGIYDKGGSRTNRIEAEAVVTEIVRRLSAPGAHRSLGVVTFNLSQQRLIEDLLEVARRQNPLMEAWFETAAAEPVFVKNLESVQGDERDVILFSLGYGPDVQGHLSMNFGPLNREGGQRRLNVAITRARQEVVVFSSLASHQIDLARVRGRGGVADLKSFLDYAERGPAALAERQLTAGSPGPSTFERQIAQALGERGWTVHHEVGCSGYRVDLAVLDPDQPDRYLLGLECDGASYHQAGTARDREVLRQAILHDLGWRLHRVWCTDWWERPGEELARIEAALEEARAARQQAAAEPPPAAATATPAEPGGEAVAPQEEDLAEEADDQPGIVVAADGAVTYRPFRAKGVAGDLENFYLPSRTDLVRRVAEKVVEVEGPLSFDLLARRVAACWEIQRLTQRVRERLEQVLGAAAVERCVVGQRVFYWPCGGVPAAYRLFRRAGDDPRSARELADIAPEEVANAAARVLSQQLRLPLEDLVRETARMLGYQRTTRQMEPWLREGIDLLIEQGRAAALDEWISEVPSVR